MKNSLLIILILAIQSLQAAIIPKKENSDNRITVIKYSPDNVIRVRTAVGVTTLIQFEQGETFNHNDSGIGIGDSSAWSTNLKGNNIFLKPIAKSPDTNLTMVSNKGRTYFFDLVTSSLPHYVVKLQYEKIKTAEDFNNDIPCLDGNNINFHYMKWGDIDLSPTYMWDDGRFTCLKFTTNLQLPVIYQIDTDGTESLVNYNIKKDTIIIHSISNEYRLRLGKQVLGLRSENTLSNGYNQKASSVNATRELNNE